MSNKSKKVGEIFSDYKTNSNIKYAEVTVLNVVKKTNIITSRALFWWIYRNKRNMVFWIIFKRKISIFSYRYKNKLSWQSRKKANRYRMEKYNSIYGT